MRHPGDALTREGNADVRCSEQTWIPRLGGRVVELLAELTDRGTALIWIGHDLGLVAAVADHVLVIDGGRVVEQGPPATVMTDPHHELTRRLLRAARLDHTQPPPVLITDTRSEPRR